jgi:putative ABC transport system substrate-binding protein
MPVIGYVHTGTPEQSPNLLAGFHRGLSETGYVEGRNVAIEYRWAHNEVDRLPELVADLVRHRVAVIAAANSGVAALAAKAATTTIPIVFNMPADPVKAGLVASYNRPGGNITGVNQLIVELGAKRLGLLQELLPAAVRFAMLVDRNNPNTGPMIADLQAAASAIGRPVEVLYAGTNRDIDAAFASLMQNPVDALLVTPSALFGARRIQLATLATRYAVPVMYHDRIFTEAGGLMSYGASLVDAYRLLGVYTGRILNGTKPADLPVVQPTKFELVINLTTAKALGLTIPETLLATADEVIE